MFGLIVASIIFMFYFINSPEDQNLYSLMALTLPFLWYWHCFFAFCKGILVFVLGGLGLVTTSVAGSDKNAKRAGIALILSSPILMVIFTISSVVFIGSVYCLSQGLDSTNGIVNERYAIVGAILYGIGILFQISTRGTGVEKNKVE